MSKVLTPILLILAAIGLFFTYLRPAYSVVQAFKDKEVELDKAITDAQTLLKKHNELMASYSSINSEDRARLDKILPDTLDIVRLILDIDAVATKHTIEIRSFEIPQLDSKKNVSRAKASKAAESPIGSAVLTIEIAGDYPDFKNFLLDIERSLTLMDVVEMTVEVPDETKPGVSDDAVVYTLGLQTYWLK